MLKSTWIIAASAFIGLSACQLSDAERGLIGAGVGYSVAKATGSDTTLGLVAGGALGMGCDNVGAC